MKFLSVRARLPGLFCVVALLLPSAADAQDPLKKIFGMMTVSAGSQRYETQTQNGIAFGTASVRFPMYEPKIVSFTPPSLSAGCGGIDFFGGSLGIMKREEIIQMMRAMASGAAVYAFNLAVETICASCAQTMQALSDKLQEFNQVFSGGCEKTQRYLESHEPKWVKDAQTNIRDSLKLDGLASSAKGSIANFDIEKYTSWMDAADDINTTDKSAEDLTGGLVGNPLWIALLKSDVSNWTFVDGWDATDMMQLIMSLSGTTVIAETADSTITAYPATITVDQLLYGPKSGDNLKILTCDTAEAKIKVEPLSGEHLPCRTILTPNGSATDWQGLYPQVLELVEGVNGDYTDGIAYKVSHKLPLSGKQLAFIEVASTDVLNIMFEMARDEAGVKMISEMIARGESLRFVKGLIDELEGIIERANNATQASPSIPGLSQSLQTALSTITTQYNEEAANYDKMQNRVQNQMIIYDRARHIMSRMGAK